MTVKRKVLRQRSGGRRGFWERSPAFTKILLSIGTSLALLLTLLTTYLQGMKTNEPMIESRSADVARYEKERAFEDRARDKQMQYMREQLEQLSREARHGRGK